MFGTDKDPEELQFRVTVDPKLGPKVLSDTVAFGENFIGQYCYRDVFDELFLDLAFGKPLPLSLVMRTVDVEAAVAIALFLHRDLAIHPRMPGLLAAVRLNRLGAAGRAHIDCDLSRFFQHLESYLSGNPPIERILGIVDGWIWDYVHNERLPQLTPDKGILLIDKIGTNGFVVATFGDYASIRSSWENLVWEQLFRDGYLRGIVTGHVSDDGKRSVSIARKSQWAQLDLVKAQAAFESAERAAGGQGTWNHTTPLRLSCAGTLIPPDALVEVLIRV
jgi:hypothetical protein